MLVNLKLFGIAFVLLGLTQSVLAATAGNLDLTFDGDGIVTTRIPNSTSSEATGIVVQPDGKVVVSAISGGVSGFDLALARYNRDGSLDTSFSGDGIVTTPFGSELDLARAIALQPNGKIIVAGSVGISPTRFAILRYNPDGILDPTFDGDGIVITTVLQNASAQAVAVQPDGKIIAAGNAINSANQDFFTVVRYNADGSIDQSFGSSGIVSVSFGGIDFLRDIAIQPDGKILAVGVGDASASNPLLALIRLNPNGSLDNSFDGDGKVASQIPLFDEANSIDLQTDGKIVIGGQLNNYFSVFRYNQNGSLDSSFSDDGVASADFQLFSRASDISIQRDGKIVGVGDALGEELDFAVARFNSGGSLDTAFGDNGKVLTAISGEDDSLSRLIIQPDGKIVGAGVSGPPADKILTVARYQNDLALSTNTKFDFDGDGKAEISLFRPSTNVWYQINSSSGVASSFQFGLTDDKITPADFDADGKTDIALFRPSTGTWYLQQSTAGFSALQFGINGDIPAPADFDGDGRADVAVFRPSTGVWYILKSSQGVFAVQFGQNRDVPQVGDFDGDNKADISVYRSSSNVWYRISSSNNQFVSSSFGINGDIPDSADYDGDGQTDLAVFRPSTGTWYLQQSTDGFAAFQFGTSGDRPAAADFDGDGKADVAVWRPASGTWFVNRTTAGLFAVQFGQPGDIPAESAFIP